MSASAIPIDKPPVAWPVVIALLLAKLLLWLGLASRYGYHGDELYFIECARHLDLGYVDHPPMVAWSARLSGALFGYGLHSLRFFPALAGAATIFLTILLAREFGGRALAQFIAGFTVLSAPVYLAIGNMLNIPVYEQVFWTLEAYLIVLAIRYDRAWLWLPIGAVAGLGLLNKHTMLLWGVGIVVGLLLTEQRKHLRTPWPWAGGLAALVVFSPNLLWQIRNGWPTLEFIQGMESGPLADIPRILFVLGQLLYQGPFFTPIWLLGLFYFFTRPGKPYRVLGWLYVVVLAILLARQGKPYYLAAAYPALFAGGAVQCERWLDAARRPWLRPAFAIALVAAGLSLAPFSAPMLPLRQTEAVVGFLFGGIIQPQEITGDFRRQVGWPEQLGQLAAIVETEQGKGIYKEGLVFLSSRYNMAAAASVLDETDGLPPAYSGHMSWYYWGPPPESARTALVHGYDPDLLAEAFESVTLIGQLVHPMGEGVRSLEPVPVYLCRQLRKPWAESWPLFRKFYHAF